MSQQTDIMSAIRQIAAERKIEVEEIVEAIKDAIKVGYKREYDINTDEELLKVDMDPEQGFIAVYAEKEIVESVKDVQMEISLKDAKALNAKAKVGARIWVDITAEGDFGRIAAQTARQIILQKLRESEKESAIKDIEHKIGQIELVTIQRILPNGDILCEINRARAVMPKADRIATEYYQLGSRVKVLLKGIEEDQRGKYIHVSRSDSDFLRELFRLEVPEVDSGTVEIVSIAREPGSRSKVAVRTNSAGIDPIGSCIGQKGVRINAIMNELKLGKQEEKVDVILWDEDIKTFIMNAIRPAVAEKVDIPDKKENKAIVLVPAEQHSLAIGNEGQNARLAGKLTGWTIEIQSDGVAEEASEEETEEAQGEVESKE
jgi:N utilization substance protein A